MVKHKSHGGGGVDAETLKMLNTKALVQMYKDEKLSFGDCLNKIRIVGDLALLDGNHLDKGEIELIHKE